MICILSPAKSMDESGGPNFGVLSQPALASKDTAALLPVCKQLSMADLKKLSGTSDAIAQKDHQRYQTWEKAKCKAACLAMNGPAYLGFDGTSLSTAERQRAQKKVRILSGLYGVLRPFDAIKPYRLEMGSKLKTSRGSTLYEFWGDVIAKQLGNEAKVIINAASQEYFKSVQAKALGNVHVITMDFPGPAVYAKKARGLICRFAVQNDCKKPDDLKKFVGGPRDPYVFDASKSSETKYVFRRVVAGKAAPKAAPKAAGKAAAKAAPKADAKASAKRKDWTAAAAQPKKRAKND
mmetsp:Transcript_102122/g.264069  ORF Transcript_102122/g.264069 Transcript_102122/m.264069 type:complete len:294 (+) Transcript_102122:97-978(+)